MVALYAKKYGLAHAPLGVPLGALCHATVGGKKFLLHKHETIETAVAPAIAGLLLGSKSISRRGQKRCSIGPNSARPE